MKTIHSRKLLLLLIVSFLTACGMNGKATTSTEDEKIKVFTTLFPIEDFTKRIGGDHVEVKSILPPGSDPHTYEPTTKTMISIAEADAFIYNGLGMETYAEDIADSIQRNKVKMVKAASGIETIEHSDNHHINDEHNKEHSEENGHDHGDMDPHVWLDPIKAITIAENIKEALIQLNPSAKKDFEDNFQKLERDLKQLDRDFVSLVTSKEDPEMIVSHAAYGYWEERYNISQIAIAGLSPSNEPSQKTLEEIIYKAKEKGLTYVLFEQNVTPKVAKSLQHEIGAEALRLHNLSVLTNKDLTRDEDYFSLMYKNLNTLDQALK